MRWDSSFCFASWLARFGSEPIGTIVLQYVINVGINFETLETAIGLRSASGRQFAVARTAKANVNRTQILKLSRTAAVLLPPVLPPRDSVSRPQSLYMTLFRSSCRRVETSLSNLQAYSLLISKFAIIKLADFWSNEKLLWSSFLFMR